jgi:hypothetical protein
MLRPVYFDSFFKFAAKAILFVTEASSLPPSQDPSKEAASIDFPSEARNADAYNTDLGDPARFPVRLIFYR